MRRTVNPEGLREDLLASPGAIEYPEYLPAGEFFLTDPDGYLLMMARPVDDARPAGDTP